MFKCLLNKVKCLLNKVKYKKMKNIMLPPPYEEIILDDEIILDKDLIERKLNNLNKRNYDKIILTIDQYGNMEIKQLV